MANELSNWEKENGYTLFDDMKVYKNFDLKFDFKFSEDSNGGIMYHNDYYYQITTNNDSLNKDPLFTLGSLRGKVTAKNLCVEGRHKDFRGFNNWNTGRIIFQNGRIEHWMNGYQIIDNQTEEKNLESIIILMKNNGVEFQSIKIKKL